MTDGDPGAPVVRRLVGVYHAEGTLRGELTYWVGARLGRAHCALCDITHGTFRERRDWQTCRAALAVPFTTFHLDDQPDDVRVAVDGRTPAVVADTDAGLRVLLGPDDLARCASSPGRLVAALEAAVGAGGLRWP